MDHALLPDIRAIVTSSPGLTYIDLSDCSEISDEGLRIMGQARCLTMLSMSRCTGIHVPALVTFLQSPSLQFLNIFGADDGVLEVAKDANNDVSINAINPAFGHDLFK